MWQAACRRSTAGIRRSLKGLGGRVGSVGGSFRGLQRAGLVVSVAGLGLGYHYRFYTTLGPWLFLYMIVPVTLL
jgi:hypothetical protein